MRWKISDSFRPFSNSISSDITLYWIPFRIQEKKFEFVSESAIFRIVLTDSIRIVLTEFFRIKKIGTIKKNKFRRKNRTTSLIQSVPWAGHAVRTVSQPRVRPTSSCIYAVTNARMPLCCHACCRSRMAIPRDCEVPLDRLAGLTRYHAPTPQGWGSCRSGVFTPRERVYFTILVKLYI